MASKIRIRIESYDHEALDRAARDIVENAKRTGARVAGPIPLPTKVERYTVLRSPHVNKKAREQFEIRTHKRLIVITEPTPNTVPTIDKVEIPAGVNISIKMGNEARVR
ncbi:MAG: 30S ribosomal protein S10 [Planctomycetota bacterium]|nr:30S ribosomal protein S10 [Planctomycetota bacterium]